MKPEVLIDPVSADRCARSIRAILSAWLVHRALLETPTGCLYFAETTYNRLDRGMLQPLYCKLYFRPYSPVMSGQRAGALKWRRATLSRRPDTAVGTRAVFSAYVLFSDASYEPIPPTATMAALLFPPFGLSRRNWGIRASYARR